MKKQILLLSLFVTLVFPMAYPQNPAMATQSSNAEPQYLYDANGNLIKDINKNMTNIEYNFLNLPKKVEFGNGRSIEYTYGADGVKRQTLYKNAGNIEKKIDYCGNYIYEDGELSKILLEGGIGYISMVGNQPEYHYYIQDHQGNNRVVADQHGNVEEVNHYYPFGGLFEQTAGNVQPYKYNGKELDTTYGLDLYDYAARQMDPKLGRFTTMDPMAEKYYSVSPYAYCANNPVKYVDPTGREMIGLVVNRNGTLRKVNDEGGTSYNVIYRSNYNPAMHKDYDETGTRSGLKVGKLIRKSTITMPVMDEAWERVGEKKNHGYILEPGEGTSKILDFIEKDLDVEVGNTEVQYVDGKKENLIMTSHEEGKVRGSTYQINRLVSKGATVIKSDHNHPNETTGASAGDINQAKEIKKHSPNAEMRILVNGRYYPY